jgi:hypothetical protein
MSIWVPGYNSSASVIFYIFNNNLKKNFSINLITISASDPASILGFLRIDAASAKPSK